MVMRLQVMRLKVVGLSSYGLKKAVRYLKKKLYGLITRNLITRLYNLTPL